MLPYYELEYNVPKTSESKTQLRELQLNRGTFGSGGVWNGGRGDLDILKRSSLIVFSSELYLHQTQKVVLVVQLPQYSKVPRVYSPLNHGINRVR